MKFSADEFRLFQNLLDKESGLFFDPTHSARLQEGLVNRMKSLGIASPHDYYLFLRTGKKGYAELKELINLITVGETYFFRNQPHFDTLKEEVLPEIIHDQPNGPKVLTVWSAGCSTGEEPYSLAITFLETLPDPQDWRLHILATDVTRESLEAARKAVYRPRAVRYVPPDLLSKYFKKNGDKYALKEVVKNLVSFSYHNLAKDPLLPGMLGVQILFCRNVTIYFQLETTRRVMERFAECIQDDGYLFIGHAETLWEVSEQFTPVEYPRTILYRKEPRRAVETVRPFISLPEPAAVMVKSTDKLSKEKLGEEEYRKTLDAISRKDYDQALMHFEHIIAQYPSRHLDALIGKASILANQGKYEEAIPVLTQVLGFDNLSSEAYYLLGTIYHKTNRFDEAIEAFKRALYVDPTLALAYFALANIYQYQRRVIKAKREFQNTLKAVHELPEDELVDFSQDIVCGYLRAACNRNLKQLTG